MVTFYLNHEKVTLADTPADLTVLDYLREHKALRGTKEGCASGDCGACTVVLATPTVRTPDSTADDTLEYTSANACILFVGALHGKQLLTVEALSEDTEHLHPVQRAMVDFHGSQCGFCTPGFVMSLFNLYQQVVQGRISKPAAGWVPVIETHLGGNLCRCTGYRPIVDAALSMLEQITQPGQTEDSIDQDSIDQQSLCRELRNITEESEHPYFYNPKSLEGLTALVSAHPKARLVAGGTDLALEVTQQLKTLPLLINVQQVRELSCIDDNEDHWRFGAAVTINQLAEVLSEPWPEFGHLLLRFGATQVRSQGTLGGNLCTASPIGDLPPALLALDATVHIHGGSTPRDISIDDFFTGYRQTVLKACEFVHSVSIAKGSDLSIYKISKRYEDDISTVCGAFSLVVEDERIQAARVAFGGMAATPKRAHHLEKALVGVSLQASSVYADTERFAAALAEDFEPMSDARASAGYRMKMAVGLSERALLRRCRTDELLEIHDYVS